MNVTSLIQVSDIKLSRTSAFSNPPHHWDDRNLTLSLVYFYHDDIWQLLPWWWECTCTTDVCL